MFKSPPTVSVAAVAAAAVLFLVLAAGTADAQFLVNRTCLERQVLENFDVKRYQGRWYELARIDNIYETGCECVTATYYVKSNKKDGLKVKNCCTRFHENSTTIESFYCLIGKAIFYQPDRVPLEGLMDINFGLANVDDCAPGQTEKARHEPRYRIFDTDYENYSIVYWCSDRSDGKSIDAFWLLSRTPTLNPDVADKVNDIIDQHFDREAFIQIEQNPKVCGPAH